MGTWGTAIKDSDAFEDIYSDFFELYNKGAEPDTISKHIIESNQDILQIEEEKHSLWFALALAQWETKSLDPKILSTVEGIITSREDLKIWERLGASEQNINKRKIALDKFLEKIKTDRPKAKPRIRIKSKTPIFSTGDCLIFKLNNGNYGGAVVLATDNNPETAYNLVATTRLNQNRRPTPSEFENAEVLILNFGQWRDWPNIAWHSPDLFYKDYSSFYEIIGKIKIDIEYDPRNMEGKGYLFKPSFTSGWRMSMMAEKQFESERTKARPTKVLTIKELIKKKWWKVF